MEDKVVLAVEGQNLFAEVNVVLGLQKDTLRIVAVGKVPWGWARNIDEHSVRILVRSS